MKILVTGGAGYIGSHVAQALAAAGFTPVVYDNLSTGHDWAVQWGPFVRGDILDGELLESVLAEYAIQGVMHFAARTEVGESVRNPSLYYQTNVEGTRILLQAMVARDVAPIVFSSSCAVYGIPQQVPIVESADKLPISPYGVTKWIGEQLLADFARAYGIRSAALRYFNAAGADRSGRIGEDHSPETHLIPLVLDVALGRRPAITIFGEDYPTPDGSCIRDYIHVSDLAAAHVAALQALIAGQSSFAVNLGTGQGISVRELITATEAVTGKSIAVVHGERRAGDPPMLYADARLAQEMLGWQPSCSDLSTILHDAWAWHQRHFSVGA